MSRTVDRFWLAAGRIAAVVGVIILAYWIVYVWGHVVRHPAAGDFHHFYRAAGALTHGENPYTVISRHSEVLSSRYACGRRPGYIYPPLIAFLYSPLAAYIYDPLAAARVSLFLNVGAVCVSLWFGARAMLERFGVAATRHRVLVAAVWAGILTFDKIKGELQMLQTNALIMSGLVLGLYFLDRAPFWAGAALGFSMNIKYQAVTLLPLLVIRRRWKAAGAMLLWTAIWAMLPAVLVGWQTETRYVAQAFGGVLRMVGIDVGAQQVADVEDMRSLFSVSITAAVARWLDRNDLVPLLASAGIGVAWLGLLAGLYRRRGVAVWAWPSARAQRGFPWSRQLGLEWMAVMAATVCFSPQTNMRHLALATIVNLGAVSVVIAAIENAVARGAAGWRRISPAAWWAIAGAVLMFCGMSFPPSQRGDHDNHLMLWWHGGGGPAWSLLLGTTLVVWAGLRLDPPVSGAVSPAPEAALAGV